MSSSHCIWYFNPSSPAQPVSMQMPHRETRALWSQTTRQIYTFRVRQQNDLAMQCPMQRCDLLLSTLSTTTVADVRISSWCSSQCVLIFLLMMGDIRSQKEVQVISCYSCAEMLFAPAAVQQPYLAPGGGHVSHMNIATTPGKDKKPRAVPATVDFVQTNFANFHTFIFFVFIINPELR